MSGARLGRRALDPHAHLDASAKPIDYGHEAIDGEATQVDIANAGKIGCGGAGQLGCGTHGQPLPVEGLDDLRREQ